MKKLISLNKLKPGEKACVAKIETKGSIRRRFLDIGLVDNAEVECIGKSPLGDPSAYIIRSCVIAIRANDCKDVFVYKKST